MYTKKFLYLLFPLFAFTSCKKDDDNKNADIPQAALQSKPVKIRNAGGNWVVYDMDIRFPEAVNVLSVTILDDKGNTLLKSEGASPVPDTKTDFVKRLWIPVSANTVYGNFVHRVSYTTLSTNKQSSWERTFSIKPEEAMVVGFPLPKGMWAAVNAPSVSSVHTNVIFKFNAPVYDQAQGGYIFGVNPQRFAIDFISIVNGKLYKTDGHTNEDWFCYGDSILAAAAGKVVKVVNNIPDHQRPPERDYETSMENIGGNVVYIEHGGGRTSFYAHMIPGSIVVKEGDMVAQGQLLGKLGNSGNSTGPHLHFHMVDNSEGKALTNYSDGLYLEGLAYLFSGFNRVGFISRDMDPDKDIFVPSAPIPVTNQIADEDEVMLVQ